MEILVGIHAGVAAPLPTRSFQLLVRGAHGSGTELSFADGDPMDYGCNGGLMDNAFALAEKEQHLH